MNHSGFAVVENILTSEECDSLMMRPLVVHSSRKMRDHARRRVIHIEYADALDF